VSVRAVGVDVGSTSCKVVLLGEDGRIAARRVEPTHPRIEEQAARLVAALRAEAGLGPEAVPLGATGYGRKRVPGATVLTEITCHARGAFALAATPGILVDMGGQDSKAIRIGPAGEVIDFGMNDKCAAGTGRFLEVILARLQVPLDEVAAVAARAERPVTVSSTCTVFAESEVIGLVADGQPLEGIVRGIHRALASRVAALARGLELLKLGGGSGPAPILMSGGVALNAAMVAALGEELGRPIRVLPEPQLVGALGAALSAVRTTPSP
jgi:predicted CoA-substrate-specific enzyme activase